ncbi:hypothetical protein HUT18_29490 [Streptomyces sp. NA04227]|uniref:hypothetical protein n=1 Tax=Streptomyces sp. NA04227 TaxID=2742136 RepID=UPI0015922CC7|nr:hypothetical protein [Streptomyces sp. NA04227]QKW09931.1 hypothetical protein HUT18_29490 [Streptomyces sp. NA04227]
MGVTATLRSVTEEELKRARRDPSYAARLIDEGPEGDETPLDSHLSVQRRTFSIERFSLNLWEALVWDAPVNVFMGGDHVGLNWDYEDKDEDDDRDEDAKGTNHDDEEDDEDSTAMELDPADMTELADWLRDIRFADACEGSGEAFTVHDDGFAYDDYGFVDEDEFNDFRTFVLAVAERGEGVLFHFA